jgi:hypothetical protein
VQLGTSRTSILSQPAAVALVRVDRPGVARAPTVTDMVAESMARPSIQPAALQLGKVDRSG